MKTYVFFLFVLSISLCFSQTLEERIYASTEQFYSEPNLKNLQILNTEIKIYEPQLKTEDEYFAFINLIVNKAFYLSENNYLKPAISAYEKANQLYKKNKVYSYDIVEYCLIPLGILYHKTNAYIKAENITKHYISLAKQQGNKTQQISGSINLARLYQSLNKHRSVISIIDKTLEFDSISKSQLQRLHSIKKRSILLMKANQDTLLLDNDIIFYTGDNLESLEQNYQLAKEKKDYEKAYSYFNQIKNKHLKNKLTSKRELAKLSFEEAQLLYLLNEPNKALNELKNTLAFLIPGFKANQSLNQTDLYPENTFIDVFDLLAAIEQNPTKKLLNYNLSFYVASLLDKETTNEESYFIEASANKTRSEKCIDILHQLYETEKSNAFIEQAINFAERNKVSYLKNNSIRKELLEKYSDNDTLLVKEHQLLKEQKLLTNRLLNFSSNQSYLKKQDSIRSRLIEISTTLKSLKETIDKKYAIGTTETITLESIMSKLQKTQTGIVEYFYGKKAIYQFVFTEKDYAFNKIPIDTSTTHKIVDFIRYFNDASKITNDIKAFTEDAYSMYNLLNLEAVNTIDKVVVIPDGFINFIPFETLLTEKTATTVFSKMPFVINIQALAYNSSLLFYLKNKTERRQEDLLGVFPVFKSTNRELIHTIDEAKAIEKHMSARLLMHESATKDRFMEQAKDYSILHLSTHASSGDFFKPATLSFSDGDLSLNELYALNLKPNLVVLSACETGVGKLLKGEGAMSLARGFQYAGAENILFSLWQINDLSTSKIISQFYAHYSEGKSAIFSNRQSKLDYLNDKSVSNAKKSPYYWGAFIFYGDLQELHLAKDDFYLLSFGIVAVLIILFLAFKLYRSNARHT
ncbi:CHAT domain-containing protein [Winogradskyella wandonensis]|uniref:CHAT domain-containing protein n=1 Tax=Winogradskyella wandonensis TaxID=1442586 RepID=A0A4R1KJX9_9FLAO|nr:CHAT domain-containing protein [Winogradskyella wandonensis]TCK65054.1 CHAT domain-containing protein [Winogradskyella wandonensis]